MQDVETEWRRLGDITEAGRPVLRGLEVILQILRLGGHFCGDHGVSATPPSLSRLSRFCTSVQIDPCGLQAVVDLFYLGLRIFSYIYVKIYMLNFLVKNSRIRIFMRTYLSYQAVFKSALGFPKTYFYE